MKTAITNEQKIFMENKYSPFGGRTVKTEVEDFKTTEKSRRDQVRENDLHDLTKSINNVR